MTFKAKLIAATNPIEFDNNTLVSLKELIAYCARVSNPSNQWNNDTADKLIAYLIKHKHFSPLEMANCVVEVECPRDIARQLLRHRSFSFQEFCVTGDSKITTLTKGGRTKRIPISELYSRYKSDQYWSMSDNLVRVFDEESGILKPAKIKEVFDTGVKPVYSLTLENGKTIKSTKDHKFLTKSGFKTLGEISTEDFVGCNGIPVYQSQEWMSDAKDRAISNGTGVSGIASEAGVSYHTIRKWLKIHELSFTKTEVASYTKIWNKGLPQELQPCYGKIHSESTREKQRAASRKGRDSALYTTGKQRSFANEVRDYWYKQKNALYKANSGICAITNQYVEYDDMEIDHILPVVKYPELAYELSNIQLIHKDEHRKKSVEESRARLETVSWHKVKSVAYVGEEQTYDMEIDHESHNYVANGIVTHNSQRYADVSALTNSFCLRDCRMQDTKNRQNSLDTDDQEIKDWWEYEQQELLAQVSKLYKEALDKGIAKEVARVILPEGLTMSRLYVNGTIRSWIHYLEVRTEEGVTQLEHVILARLIAEQIRKVFDVSSVVK